MHRSGTRRGGPSVSLLFPAWNEEDYAPRALERALAVLPGIADDFEILVVDDGSTDRTRAVVLDFAERDPRVRLLSHAHNRGLGAALRTGFARSTKEVVVYSDIDLPFDLEEVGRALRLLQAGGGDLVCAFRHDRGSEGIKRETYSFVYNLLVRGCFQVRIRDVNFGFKAIHRRVLEGIELRSEGSFVDAELVVKAVRRGFRLLQMGVDYFPRTRGTSTLSSPRVIAGILVDLVRLGPSTSAPGPALRPARPPLRAVASPDAAERPGRAASLDGSATRRSS